MGKPSRDRAIEKALLGKDQATRVAAASKLSEVPEAAAPLARRALDHWDRRTRVAAAHALVAVVGAEAIPELRAALEADRLPLLDYLRAVGKLPADEAAHELARFVSSERVDARKVARRALRAMPVPGAGFARWTYLGRIPPSVSVQLEAANAAEVRAFLQRLPADQRLQLLLRRSTWRYLVSRGLDDLYGELATPAVFPRVLSVWNEKFPAAWISEVPAEQLRAELLGMSPERLQLLGRIAGFTQKSVRGTTGWEVKTEFSAAKGLGTVLEAKGLVAEVQKLIEGRVATIATRTGLSGSVLGHFYHRWSEIDGMYAAFTIPKKKGGSRTIVAPEAQLKYVQRTILKTVLEPASVHPACHGFAKGRSVVTNARDHVGHEIVVNLDLRDFFPSIKGGRVFGVFRTLGFDEHDARFLTALCTREGRLPQGAPTSPALANIVCRRLDARLTGLASTVEATYTRYADDLSFSGPRSILSAIPMVVKILGDEGFVIAREKLRIIGKGNRQEVTGLVVNESVSVPRETRRKLRAALHHLKHQKAIHWNGREVDASVLQGVVAFIKPVQPALAAACSAQLGSRRPRKRPNAR